jgi:hypothetical protein
MLFSSLLHLKKNLNNLHFFLHFFLICFPFSLFFNACFWFVTYSHHLFPQCMLLVCCILPSLLSSTPTCSSPTYSSFVYVTCSLNLLMLPACHSSFQICLLVVCCLLMSHVQTWAFGFSIFP